MNDCSELIEVLRPHLNWHRARLRFLAAFVLALIRVGSVNLAQVALGLNPWVQIASNYRRCQRFLAEFSFDQETIGRLILQLLPQDTLCLCLDRTEWKFGRLSINLLFIGVAHQGVAYPLVWCFLGKAGSSSLRERLRLLRRLLSFLPKERIQTLLADREFACTGFLRYLRWHKLPYTLRIKAGSRVSYRGKSRPALQLFRHLRYGQWEALPKPVKLWGQRTYLMGGYLKTGEYLLLITQADPQQAHLRYAQRWEIETLFKAFKSQGFDFESTHLTRAERLESLIALMSIALVWAHKVGEWLSQTKPIPLKNRAQAHTDPTHKARKLYSTFRYGLDHLRQLLFAAEARKNELHACMRLLSCT